MGTFLNLALLFVGTVATLTAFGGKTWREGSEPIIERVTPRGWVSLACLVAALIFGVWKQFDDEADKESDSKRHTVEQQALQAKLDKAETEVAGITDLNREMKSHLDDQGVTLGNVRGNLASTEHTLTNVETDLVSARSDLEKQSTASMISALSDSKLTVSAAWFGIFVNAPGKRSTILTKALLPHFSLPVCSDLVGVSVVLHTGTNSVISLRPDSDSAEYSNDRHVENGFVNMVQLFFRNNAERYSFQHVLTGEIDANDRKNWPYPAGESAKNDGPRQPNGMYLSSGFDLRPGHIAAAAVYSEIMRGDSIAEVETSWPEEHEKFYDVNKVIAEYGKLHNVKIDQFNPRNLALPVSCSNQIKDYFHASLGSAILTVLIGTQETITFKVGPGKPVRDGNEWKLPFFIMSPPLFKWTSPQDADRSLQPFSPSKSKE